MTMSEEKPTQITFSNQTIVRVVLLVIASLLGLEFVRNISHALTLIFIAFFLSLALNPAVSWIARHLPSKSRVKATGLAYITVLALLITFFALVGPPVVRQIVDFAQTLPANIQDYKQQNAVIHFIQDHNLQSQFNALVNGLKDQLSAIAGTAVDTVGRIGDALISVLTVLVLTFMMLVEGPKWIERLVSLQHPHKREKRTRVARRMYGVITGYVNGQVLIALIAGTFACIVLFIVSTLLGVTINAVVYAFIIALTSLIPMIGATIGAVVVVVLCLFTSVPLAIIMGVFFLVYQQIENATIQPYIQAKNNELTPLIVFIAAMVGIGFGGLLGAFVAIPLAGCLRAFLLEYYGDKLTPKKVPHESPSS